MLKSINDTFQTVFAPEFSLEDLPGFPYEAWENQLSSYEEMERWFTGEALDNQPGIQKKSSVDYYPMRINPLKRTIYKHAYMLFGEAENSATMQVQTKFVPRNENEKNICEDTEQLLTDIWDANAGRALLMENAILSQIYGGCVFKISYVPWESVENGGWRQYPIQISGLNPKEVVLTPLGGDNYRLREAWIIKTIRAGEAEDFGYPNPDPDSLYWYTEYWTKERFIIRINNRVAIKGGQALGGENPYKEIPIVYIPHIRAGSFLGLNVIDDLKGLIRELNLRMGDYGDAINDDAHPVLAMRDVNGNPRMVTINEWLEVLDLHSTMNMTGGEKSPDIWEVRTTRASTAMKDIVEQILAEYRRDSFTPAVSDGEDEGSQRSGMTLATRFWPLISHASTERFFWTPGLNLIQYYILKMLLVLKLAEITEDHLKLRMKQQWAPQLPRDREAQVNEWQIRKTAQIASIEHLLELSGDVEDVKLERERIIQDIIDLEEAKASIEHKYALDLQERQAETDIEMQEETLATQEKVAKTQASAFSGNKAQAGKKPPTAKKKPGGA